MKIYKKVLTFSTTLETKHNENVINNFEDTVPKYSTMKRHALHIIRNNPEIKENILNKYLQDRYGVTTRTANSCIKEVKGIVNSAIALLSLNIEKIENRIKDKRKNLEAKRKQLAKTLSDVCNYALAEGKDIIIENLKNFKKKKAKTRKAKTRQGKEYNDMFHKLPYSIYSQLIEDMCFKRKISLVKINPYNTSKIARQKFCKRMNLNIHNGAAYVIARRGMEIKDVYVKKVS